MEVRRVRTTGTTAGMLARESGLMDEPYERLEAERAGQAIGDGEVSGVST